jgi:peptide/nickel transport system substrate-binding protein
MALFGRMAHDTGSNSKRLALSTNRRRFLQAASVGVTVGVAGCFGSGDDEELDVSDVEAVNEDGDQVELTLYRSQGDSQQEQIANQISDNLSSRLGIAVNVEAKTSLIGDHFNSEPLDDADPGSFEFGPVGRNAGPPEKTRMVSDWDMLIGIQANAYPRTPDNTNAFWLKDSPTNAYGYVPEVDMAGLYSDFRSTTDEAERKDIANEIFGTLSEQLPANFVSQIEDQFAIAEDVNTDPEFNEYGYEGEFTSRYRGDQSVGGDYTWLTDSPFNEVFLPEVSDVGSTRRHALTSMSAYEINPNEEIVPLMIDIEDSGDGQVYVCTVRDNMEWGTDADGNSYGQVTAEDWVFQTNMVHGVADDAADFWNEETPPSAQVSSYDVISNVEQTGEFEFQVELNRVDPDFPLRPVLWGEYLLPKDLFEQYAPDATALRQSDEVTNWTWTGNLGAYNFDSRTPGAAGQFNATRADDFFMRDAENTNIPAPDGAWGDAPYFDTYRFDVEPEEATLNERMRNLEGDIYEPPADVVREFDEAVDGLRVETTPNPFISMMFYNQRSNGNPIVREQEGRAAIGRVIDKEAINKEILRGLAKPAHTHQPTWSSWYQEDVVNEIGVGIDEDIVREAREQLGEVSGISVEEV